MRKPKAKPRRKTMSLIDTRPADIENLHAKYHVAILSDPSAAKRISLQLHALQESLGRDMEPFYELLKPWRRPS
jgi:hypothetical protein